MESTFLWIVVVAVSLLLLFITVRLIIKKAFYHPPVKNCDSPEKYRFEYQEYFLTTKNGKKIQTYLIAPDNLRPFIIGIHGWANCADRLFPMAENLAARGWRLLLVNSRNHGESDEDDYSTMVKFIEDVETGIRFIIEEFGTIQPVLLMGHSLGGATVINVAARNPHVKAAASIAAFSDMDRLLRKSFADKKVPGVLIQLLFRYIELKIGEKFNNISPNRVAARLDKPLLLIHGDKDNLVPVSEFEELKRAVPEQHLHAHLLPGEDHSSLLKNPELYDLLDSFFSSSLK